MLIQKTFSADKCKQTQAENVFFRHVYKQKSFHVNLHHK